MRFQRFSPYSVVVTNSGSQALIGIDVRFSIKFADRTVPRNFFYNSFPQPDRPLLPAGRSLLVTPIKSANAIAGGAPIRQGSGGALNSADDQSVIQMLISAQEVNISIDLVVAADGRTAGPDLAKSVKKLAQQKEAYSALRSELLARSLSENSPGHRFSSGAVKDKSAIMSCGQKLPSLLPG